MSPSLNLVTVGDAGYAHGIAALLWSARRYLKRNVTLAVFVIAGQLAPGDVEAFEEALKRAGGPYKLTVVPAPEMDDLRKGHTRNALTFARMFIPEMFPHLDRVLYVDADIVIHRDLSELLEIEFGEALVCAVRDKWVPTLGTRNFVGENLPIEEFGLDPEAPYFNAGVFWMNLTAWRETRFGERALKLSRERADQWICQDQSPLNILLFRRWRELDETWNLQTWLNETEWQITAPVPAILHFTNAKPWQFPLDRPIGVNRLFAKILRESGWMAHRPPTPKYKNPFEDSLTQRAREFRRWVRDYRHYGKLRRSGALNSAAATRSS